MNPFHALRCKSFSSILGIEHWRVELPDPEVVIGIDPNLAVVRRPRIRISHLLPRLAFVLAAISAALLVLHDRVNDVRFLAVNIQSDAAGLAAVLVRHPFRQFFPCPAPTTRLINRAIRPATVESISSPPPLVARG